MRRAVPTAAAALTAAADCRISAYEIAMMAGDAEPTIDRNAGTVAVPVDILINRRSGASTLTLHMHGRGHPYTGACRPIDNPETAPRLF